MKLTKSKLKQIIKEELFLHLEMFDTGSAGEPAGAMSNTQKKVQCEKSVEEGGSGGTWVEGVGCKELKEELETIADDLGAQRQALATAQKAAGHGDIGFIVQSKEQITETIKQLLKMNPAEAKPIGEWLRKLAEETEALAPPRPPSPGPKDF